MQPPSRYFFLQNWKQNLFLKCEFLTWEFHLDNETQLNNYPKYLYFRETYLFLTKFTPLIIQSHFSNVKKRNKTEAVFTNLDQMRHYKKSFVNKQPNIYFYILHFKNDAFVNSMIKVIELKTKFKVTMLKTLILRLVVLKTKFKVKIIVNKDFKFKVVEM